MSHYDDILQISCTPACTDSKCSLAGPTMHFNINFFAKQVNIGRSCWVHFGLTGGRLAISMNVDQTVKDFNPKFNLPLSADGSVSVGEKISATVAASGTSTSGEQTTTLSMSTANCNIQYSGKDNICYFGFITSSNSGLIYGNASTEITLSPSASENCAIKYQYEALESDWGYTIVRMPRRNIFARILFEMETEAACEAYIEDQLRTDVPVSDNWKCSNDR